MQRPLALVVDRDPNVRARIREAFESQQVEARGASSAAETMDALSTRPVRIIVVDTETPGVDMIQLIGHASQLSPSPVVIAVAPDQVERQALDLFGDGVFDVLPRPIDDGRLRATIKKALEHQTLLEEVRRLRQDLQSREGYHGLVGRSEQMERLRETLTRLAPSEGPVWFHGETGTGKELAARTLHARSPRAEKAFVVVPPAIIGPDGGDEEGSDEGLPLPRALLDRARGGTIYLEDVAALAPETQARLLAGLDRVGQDDFDVRVLSASTLEPGTLADQGRLINALRARLAGETLALAPLRERASDVPVLARYFVSTICAINHLEPIQLSPEALDALGRDRWPDNVQGLREAMEQAVILCEGGKIRPGDLPDRLRGARTTALPAGAPVADGSLRRFREAKREVVEVFEQSYLSRLMERYSGNVTAASQQAGMLRSALQRLLRKYGLKSADFRAARRADKAEESLRPRR